MRAMQTKAAVADRAGPEFGLDRRRALIAFTFMYQLGQALGGLVLPPFSELIGRRTPYLLSTFLFSLSCLVLAAAPSVPAVFTFRFLAGLASAVPSVVIAGSVEDIFDTKSRVWIFVLWNTGTTVGLCVGPVYAAYITHSLKWTWVFYSAAAVTGTLFVALLGVRESRPSLLFGRKIEALRRTGRVKGGLEWYNTDSSKHARTLVELVLIRPMRILLTEPLVIMVAVISAVSWGLIYLFTEALTPIYLTMGFSREQASLPFMAIAVGVLFTFLPRFWDMKIVKRKGRAVQPEDKIPGFLLALPLLTAGLFAFSVTIPPLVPAVHPLVPTAALIPVGYAVNEMAYTLSGYLADSYLLFSASAFAGLALVRAIVAGLMPLVALEMYEGLGTNAAGGVLGGVSVLFWGAGWVFVKKSRGLRERSRFARFSVETEGRTGV
ncbi:major facilitator superfamily transporter [Coniochaeta sp. 2T2.1]|nr:major facilitator superfamily transporter [Coniochaeta sp. 2T2.1]